MNETLGGRPLWCAHRTRIRYRIMYVMCQQQTSGNCASFGRRLSVGIVDLKILEGMLDATNA
jgi:hypothetical protein